LPWSLAVNALAKQSRLKVSACTRFEAAHGSDSIQCPKKDFRDTALTTAKQTITSASPVGSKTLTEGQTKVVTPVIPDVCDKTAL
jgi:hypothetical protein